LEQRSTDSFNLFCRVIRQILRSEAQARGIDPRRLIFAKRMKLDAHLARHCLADLFLDTLPYNTHTTAIDALWSGLPVLTLIGRSFASREAASLLKTVGLKELICNTQAEYESRAIELGLNPEKLASLKKKLATKKIKHRYLMRLKLHVQLKQHIPRCIDVIWMVMDQRIY